jgi:hypothetical protein
VAPMNQKWNNKRAYTKTYFPPFFSEKIKIQKTGAKSALNDGIELLSLRISMIAAIFFFRSHRQTTIINAQRRLRNYENVKHCERSEEYNPVSCKSPRCLNKSNEQAIFQEIQCI